jgi:tRNA G18 (ribose-2'-O)-methylase SpoU
MATVFLHAPQDFRNICLLARTLEAFGHRECHIFDPHRLIRERYGKSRTRDQRSISAGAFEKMLWIRVESPEEFLASHDGRVVATVANAEATPLGHHQFAPTDLLLFGSESHGLPPKVIAACAATVTIPTRGQTQSLNLVVALGNLNHKTKLARLTLNLVMTSFSMRT